MFNISRLRRSIVGLSLFLVFAIPAAAHDFQIGAIKIEHPWTRATAKGARVGAGYMKITNTGTTPDRLIGGDFVASARFEVHEMAVDSGGVMRMRALAAGIAIPPGASIELKPGGYHAMFIDLKTPLEKDKSVKGRLIFEQAGSVDVEYAVEAQAAAAPGHHHAH